jgi:hypothetical protein
VANEDDVDYSTCQKYFLKFRINNFYFSNAARPKLLAKTDDNRVLTLIESDQHKTTPEIR